MNVTIRTGTVDELLAIDKQVPEFEYEKSEEFITSRLSGKTSLILVACIDNKLVAYKTGYATSATEFYSWLGGVVPSYRKRGIATKLRQTQELWAIEHGYSYLSVKSMNKFPAMLQLLISSGYQISGYEDNGSLSDSKIKFLKKLNLSSGYQT